MTENLRDLDGDGDVDEMDAKLAAMLDQVIDYAKAKGEEPEIEPVLDPHALTEPATVDGRPVPPETHEGEPVPPETHEGIDPRTDPLTEPAIGEEKEIPDSVRPEPRPLKPWRPGSNLHLVSKEDSGKVDARGNPIIHYVFKYIPG